MKKWDFTTLVSISIILVVVGCQSSNIAVPKEPITDPTNSVAQSTHQPELNVTEGERKEALQDTKVIEQIQPTPSSSPTKGEKGEGPQADAMNKEQKPDVSPPPSNANPSAGEKGQLELPENNTTSGTSDKIQKEIIKKYEDQLLQLKAADLDKLERLYGQVMAANKSGLSRNELYDEFSQKASTLEEETQAQVNQVLLQLKNELVALHLSAEIVIELRSVYYSEVNKAEQGFINKLNNSIGK